MSLFDILIYNYEDEMTGMKFESTEIKVEKL